VPRRRPCLPVIDDLENRRLLATFTVVNTADSGTDSSRQAILDANAGTCTNTINFNDHVGTKNSTREEPALSTLDHQWKRLNHTHPPTDRLDSRGLTVAGIGAGAPGQEGLFEQTIP
jgi:hypothetical protein